MYMQKLALKVFACKNLDMFYSLKGNNNNSLPSSLQVFECWPFIKNLIAH